MVRRVSAREPPPRILPDRAHPPRSENALLHVVRAHSKVPGKKAELDSPFALRKGSTVLDMARAVHKDFAEKLDFARIWSKDGTIDGLRVNRDHVLNDEDIVELHI